MAINWYPGHMHKAQKEIKEIISDIDLIIEVLDARIPHSSENPMIASLRGDTPCLKILNKADMADSAITDQWIDYFRSHKNTDAIAVNARKPDTLSKIIPLCQQVSGKVPDVSKKLRIMICGIPNVGKSTTINALAKRIIAKTGNEPAVTKMQQRINIEGNILLIDTPGMLWPKVESEDSGYRLAVTGAIKETAYELDDVAMYLADYLLEYFPDALQERYQLDELERSGYEQIEAIGRKRGCLRAGGRVEINQASKILLTEYREVTLGTISMETPEMVIAETEEIERQRQLKTDKDKERKKKFKRKRR